MSSLIPLLVNVYANMQAVRLISKSRQLGVARVLESPSPILYNSPQLDELAIANAPDLSRGSPPRRSSHSAAIYSPGITHGNISRTALNHSKNVVQFQPLPMMVGNRLYSSEQTLIENPSADTETAKGVYDKMLNSVAERRTAPPNAWLWSLIAKCSSSEDINLLFDILKRLRIFRLSNLRIAENFNSALSIEVTKACVRVGAIDLGKKALWRNNLIGLTPEIGSAHYLLIHAKQHGDVKLMIEIMNLVKENELPLQPGTADIVFSICSSANRWNLISKYGKRFVKSGVKLRQTSFEIWMEFATKRGDVESLWKIEKWRAEAMKKHSLSTGFSCAKGFLLDHKPERAAAIIQELNQSLSDARRENIVVELQKLASEWPLELIKQQKDENKKAFAAALQTDISAMIDALSSLGMDANVILEDLSSKLEISS